MCIYHTCTCTCIRSDWYSLPVVTGDPRLPTVQQHFTSEYQQGVLDHIGESHMCIRLDGADPLHHRIVRATQHSLFPDSPQVESIVNVVQGVTLDQQQIGSETRSDLATVDKIEALCVEVCCSS